MNSMAVIWLEFALGAALIGVAGYQLSRCGDAIAQRTGLSGSWIGLALLATVTSLPELAMGGLFFKPGRRVMRAISWVSLGLAAMYLPNTCVLNLHGE